MTHSNARPSAAFLAAARVFSSTLTLALCVLALLIGTTSMAMAQQSTSQFSAASNINTPQGGLILAGTGINPATGNPFRHLWTADPVNGLCRLDPAVDSTDTHTINLSTCLTTINPGQLTFDPASNTIYAVDGGNKSGIFVVHFQPNDPSGHGALDLAAGATILGPTCGIATNQPNATSLGPDGNLYVGFRRSGNIMRIISPTTNPLPCTTTVQSNVIVTGDKLTSQMAWVGHNLFLNNSRLPVFVNSGTTLADACFTPQNGNVACSAFSPLTQLPTAQATMVSDQTPGLADGTDIYYGGSVLNSVTAETGVTFNFLGLISGQGTFTSPFGAPGPGINFTNISALAVDTFDPTNHVLYVGDDPTAGAIPGTGRWFQVLTAPPPPGPPSAPLNVTATAGNASASLNWTAPGNHQPVTSYTVHNSLASNGLPVADITLAAAPGSTIVPTSASITGLVNTVTYQFQVLATNSQGSSPFSAPSNAVTPQAPTVPGQPTITQATPFNAAVSVAWNPPASDGGSPITGYTISAFTGGVLVSTTPALSNQGTVINLTNGVAYTFTVHASNIVGNGPESVPSAPVTPGTAPNVTITMSDPGPIVAGNSAVYQVKLTNVGSATATAVTLSDTPGTAATVSSVTTSQGTCNIVSNTVNCNVGAIAAGGIVIINVTTKPSAQTTNTATVQFTNGINTASVTTTVIPLNQTTDVQLVGAAQNGGPAVTASDTFTWQIKNAQTVAASGVIFTSQLPSTMVFQGASSGCTSTQDPTRGITTVTCNLGTVSGGQAEVVNVTVGFTTTGTMSTTGSVTLASPQDNNPNNNNASITVGVK